MLQLILATTYIAAQNPDLSFQTAAPKEFYNEQIIAAADTGDKQIQTLEQINADLMSKKAAAQPFDEKDVKVDVESLGLDSVDKNLEKSSGQTKSSEVKEADLPLPTSLPDSEQKNPPVVFDFAKDKKSLEEEKLKQERGGKIEINPKEKFVTTEQKKFEDFLSRIQSKKNSKEKKSDVKKEEKATTAKVEAITKGEGESKVIDSKNVEKSNADLSKDNTAANPEEKKDVKPNQVLSTTASDLKKPTKKYLASLKKRELKRRIEAERKKAAIFAREKREKEKLAKLEKLRQEYLIKINTGDEEEEVDTELYNDITKIVPRKKEIGRYLSYELPAPPILNRYRTTDNANIPTILTKKERVDILFGAATSGDTSYFDNAYNDIQQPNVKNANGDTVLTYATLLRKYNMMASILKKGADPNMPNSLGYTPIAIAIEMSDPQAVNLLINNNADIGYIDKFGRSYLMQAARVGSLPIVDMLVSKGLDVNAIDKDGFTALSVAYRYHKEIIVQYLLKRGAKTWVEKPYDSTTQSLIKELEGRWNY